MTDSPQPEDIDSQITDLVERHWQEHQTPLLLSRLGDQVSGEIARLDRLEKAPSEGLGNYIRRRLADRMRVIQHSVNPTITGVLPAKMASKTVEEINALLEKTLRGSSAAKSRFHPAFWAAFRKPLNESNRRYMSIEEPIRFQESSEESHPSGFLEVPGSYISNSAMDDDQTLQNAENWLTDHNLRKDIYLIDAKSKPDLSRPRNLLDRLLFSLEPKELSRISMPLDIILKLRKQAP